MILVVKAQDLKVGMECVGPLLFADYGVVNGIEAEDGQMVVMLDGGPSVVRAPGYEFEVLVV